MNRSKLLNILGVGSIFATGSLMAATAHAVLPQVGVYGPQGQRIAFERTGPKGSETITIREFELLTNESEIEAKSRVTRELNISESSFRELLKSKLESMDQSVLTAEQKKLLSRSLFGDSRFANEKNAFIGLKMALERIETALKEEGPAEYLNELKRTTEEAIQCAQDQYPGLIDLINAKSEVDAIVDNLIKDMDGSELNRVLKHNDKDDKGGIAFNLLGNLLHEIVSSKKCGDLSGVRKPGTFCVTSQGTVFERVSQPEAGWRVVTANGKTWFDAVNTRVNHAQAQHFCNRPGLALPKSEDYRSFRAYFERDSDGYFTDAGRKELYALFPNMVGKWFWSDTLHPGDSDLASGFDGNSGGIGNGSRASSSRYYYYAVRCVSAPSVER